MDRKNVAVIGGGSGLGQELVLEELNKSNKVTVLSSIDRNEIYHGKASCFVMDLNNLDVNKLDEILKSQKISKIYFCSVIASHKNFKNFTYNEIINQVNFNVTSVVIILNLLVKKYSKIKLVFILSHVCFIFSPGFALYRMYKKAIEDLLLSIEIENPQYLVTRVYPGAIDTNFTKNTNYSGVSIFKKKSPKWWARKIVNSKSNEIISIIDRIIQFIDYLIPFSIKKWLYSQF